MKKVALILGCSGQDGSYLSELLLDKGYRVYGGSRRSSTNNKCNLQGVLDNPDFTYVEVDVTDYINVSQIIEDVQPDEVYNLAAQSVTEDNLLPIKSAQKIEYRTLKSLWKEQIKKHKSVRVEDGYIEVIDIPNNRNLKALGYWNGMGTWFNITQISRHKWNGKVVKIKQKFGSVTVTPNHCLLDVNQKLCTAEDNRWLLSVRQINYNGLDINGVDMNGSHGLSDGIYFYKKQSGKRGGVLKCVGIDKLDALCEFIGAFVAEGHTTYNKNNNTFTANISEQSIDWLKHIQKQASSFIDATMCIITHKKEGYDDVYRLEIKSKYLYDLLRKWCGTNSYTKCLPHWFTKLSTKHMQLLFDKLIEGDGCYCPFGWRYTTSSYKLACQLGWLFTRLGYQYTLNTEHNDEYNKDYYHFRQCESYQPNQGLKSIEYIDYNGYVYDITVEEVNNFTVGIGNIVVHNSHVQTSFNEPLHTWRVNAEGPLNILESVRRHAHNARVYQASTSEMMGRSIDSDGYQRETTQFSPQSPYAIAKLAAHHKVELYRKAYGLFVCSGVLFNHESERRGEAFISRKVTKYVAELADWLDQEFYTIGRLGAQVPDDMIYRGKPTREGDSELFPKLRLGNLDSQRDWGYAPDYVEAMWLMLQQDWPKDYVISTGHTWSVADLVGLSFAHVGIKNWQDYVVQDPQFIRPSEVVYLKGDSSLAQKELGWKPKVKFDDMLGRMIDADRKCHTNLTS